MIRFFKKLIQRFRSSKEPEDCSEHHIGYMVGIKTEDTDRAMYFYRNLSEVAMSHPSLKRSTLYKFFKKNKDPEAKYTKKTYWVKREFEEIC
jgi:hypothetical protein